jgi:uncharacterized spore protein YtfJ
LEVDPLLQGEIMSTEELIESAVEHVQARAGVQAVYGEPVAVDGKTIVPVAKVAFGFAGGTAAKKTSAAPEEESPAAGESGEGAGGGLSAKPVGVVEISDAGTKFAPFAQTKRLTIAAAIGSGLGRVLGLLAGRRRNG